MTDCDSSKKKKKCSEPFALKDKTQSGVNQKTVRQQESSKHLRLAYTESDTGTEKAHQQRCCQPHILQTAGGFDAGHNIIRQEHTQHHQLKSAESQHVAIKGSAQKTLFQSMSQLRQLAQEHGYYVVDVQVDGNCLFHSVAMQKQPSLDHATLRQLVLHREKHPYNHLGNRLSEHLVQSPNSSPTLPPEARWERYVAQMAQHALGMLPLYKLLKIC